MAKLNTYELKGALEATLQLIGIIPGAGSAFETVRVSNEALVAFIQQYAGEDGTKVVRDLARNGIAAGRKEQDRPALDGRNAGGLSAGDLHLQLHLIDQQQHKGTGEEDPAPDIDSCDVRACGTWRHIRTISGCLWRVAATCLATTCV